VTVHSSLAARLVAAADEDRRGLERQLHDGAQQSLAAVAVKLQLARMAPDPTALLDEIANDVQDAIEELRGLAWRLFPSFHGPRGLSTALRTAAAVLDVPLTLDVDAAEQPEAIYFCCLAALEAAHGETTLRIREAGFELTGSFETASPSLLRLTDRVAAVGGTLSIQPTHVEGTLTPQPLSAR
jgi:signal transduction histidine kinase